VVHPLKGTATPNHFCGWGIQAIDYSWANLMSYHAVQTSSARIHLESLRVKFVRHGMVGGGSTDVFSSACLVVFCIFFFCTRNHAYVCICRNIGHLYIYIHIHICIHTCSYTYTCIRPRTYTHAYIHTYTYIHTYMHTYVHTPTRIYTRIHIYIHMHELPRSTYICTHILHPYTPPHPHPCTPPLSRFLTVRNTCTPFSCKKM